MANTQNRAGSLTRRKIIDLLKQSGPLTAGHMADELDLTPMSPARVLWREVPNWHTLPGNPASEICKGNSAYARAANLHSAPAAGRLANQVA